MGIVEEDIARVRAATDMLGLVGEYVQLRQVGQRWVGLCPFHTEKTGSFNVNPVDGFYYCFGCQARGDAIAFVREMEHLDFPAAMERLAGKVGISLTYTSSGEGEGRKERSKLSAVVEQAENWYHERLLSHRDAAEARAYLRERGFDGDSVREWKLGWAPDAWDELSRGLRLSKRDAIAAGLGKESRRGTVIDHFRGRVLFPIHDVQGRPIGFGGRILPGHEGPKYINTTQTKLYDKSSVLFALDRAKAGIVQADEVIVCEGYTDVIAFFDVGLPRAVATCGTALTDDHVQLLRRFARRIVLAFDADGAGQAAADRFYQWEQKHDLDVVVAALPAGVDPGELGTKDPDALRSAVANARPFLEFRLARVLDGADFDSAEHRARAASEALEVIAEHPDDFVRDAYVMQVADRCLVDANRLRTRLDEVRRKPRPKPAPASKPRRDDTPPVDDDPGPAEPGWSDSESGPPADDPRRVVMRQPRDSAATEVLRLAVNRPEAVVDWLDECLFDEPLHLEAYRALVEAATIHEAIDASSPDVSAFLSRLAVEEPVEDALDPVLLLLRSTGQRLLHAARATAPPDLSAIATIARLMGRLGPGADGVVAARELLGLAASEGTSS